MAALLTEPLPRQGGGVSKVVCERQRCIFHQPFGVPRGVVASHIGSTQPQEEVYACTEP
jgi:hypothetical protein